MKQYRNIPLMSIATLISMGYKVQYAPQCSGIIVVDDRLIRIRNICFLQIVDGNVSALPVAMKLDRLDIRQLYNGI